jgi:hypothetical protein
MWMNVIKTPAILWPLLLSLKLGLHIIMCSFIISLLPMLSALGFPTTILLGKQFLIYYQQQYK